MGKHSLIEFIFLIIISTGVLFLITPYEYFMRIFAAAFVFQLVDLAYQIMKIYFKGEE